MRPTLFHRSVWVLGTIALLLFGCSKEGSIIDSYVEADPPSVEELYIQDQVPYGGWTASGILADTGKIEFPAGNGVFSTLVQSVGNRTVMIRHGQNGSITMVLECTETIFTGDTDSAEGIWRVLMGTGIYIELVGDGTWMASGGGDGNSQTYYTEFYGQVRFGRSGSSE